MPYTTTWSHYEKFEGEVNINGQHHSYVKRKVSGDTLYLLCIPNRQKDKLQLAKNEYGKKVNDFEGSDKKDTGKKGTSPVEYITRLQQYAVAMAISIHQHPSTFITHLIPQFHLDNPGKPPEVNS